MIISGRHTPVFLFTSKSILAPSFMHPQLRPQTLESSAYDFGKPDTSRGKLGKTSVEIPLVPQ